LAVKGLTGQSLYQIIENQVSLILAQQSTVEEAYSTVLSNCQCNLLTQILQSTQKSATK